MGLECVVPPDGLSQPFREPVPEHKVLHFHGEFFEFRLRDVESPENLEDVREHRGPVHETRREDEEEHPLEGVVGLVFADAGAEEVADDELDVVEVVDEGAVEYLEFQGASYVRFLGD